MTKKNVDLGQMVIVLNGDFVQGAIIYAHV